MLCLCLGGERQAAGEPGQRGEAAADGRAVRVALPAAAPLDVLRQEVRQSLLDLQPGKGPKKKLLLRVPSENKINRDIEMRKC